MGAGGPVKVCAGCGVDVSGSPRVKDAAGRYFCAVCAERLRGAAAAEPTGGAPRAPAQFRGLAVCAGCGSSVPHGAAVCVQCGLNQQTGRAAATVVRGPEPEPVYADPMQCAGCGERLTSLSKRTCPKCGLKNRNLSARERGKASSGMELSRSVRRLLIATGVGLLVLVAVVSQVASDRGLSPWVGAALAAGWWLADFIFGMLLYLLASLTYKGVGDALWLIALRVGAISAIMPSVGWLLGLLKLSVLGLILYICVSVELTARFLDMEYQEAIAFAFIWSIASWFGNGPLIGWVLGALGVL